MIPLTFFNLVMMRKTCLYCVGVWFYFIYWKTLNRFKKMQNPNKVAGRKHQPLPLAVLCQVLQPRNLSGEAGRQAGHGYGTSESATLPVLCVPVGQVFTEHPL